MKAGFLAQLEADFPEYRFRKGDKFAFRPPRTIMIGPDEPQVELLLLHEVAHAVLEHRDFEIDIDRVKMEAEAWEKARELAEKYGVEYDEDLAQNELDSYRDWLHKKSRCPECGLTRFQDIKKIYHCPRCESFYSTSDSS